MTDTPQNPPPGYYPDSNGVQRWWDGNAWTENVQPLTQTAPEPAATQTETGAPTGPAARNPNDSRPWFKKKRWLLTGGVIGVFIIASALGGGGTESDDSNDTAADTTSTTDSKDVAKDVTDEATAAPKATSKPKPKPKVKVVKVSAEQILKDYEDNELAADQKYKGKRIQVTGIVDEIDTELFNDDQYVLRISNGDEFSFLTVNCNDMDQKELSKLTVGNEVTAVGQFDDGGDLGIELKKCEIA